jgi:hypothetical protein
MIELEVTIPVASEWPSRDELAARNAAETALRQSNVAICSGAGGGMGEMHLTFRVADQTAVHAARAAIEQAMCTHMPGFEYRVRLLGGESAVLPGHCQG